MQAKEITTQEIRTRIKQIVSNVTNIAVEDIADNASYRDDLALDSLSLLEIAVDVDYEFKLGLPEEEMQGIQTVEDAVTLVRQRLEDKAASQRVA